VIRGSSLFDEMAMKSARQTVDVIGLVHPYGAGGGMNQGERRWTMTFSVNPWRIVGEEINESELVIRQKGLTEQQLERKMKSIVGDSIVRVRVRFPVRPSKPPSAELIKYLRKDKSDAEMNKCVKALKKPVAVKNRYFGKFKFEREMNWYVTNFKWNGKKIELSLPLDDCKDEEAFFRLAEKLCKQQKKWDRAIRNFAADELLERKNEEWREEDEEIITRSEFLKRIKLQAITLYPDGCFGFTFDDGDIFWGHLIEVEGSMDDGPEDVSVEG
jgi:hypothetical protein